MRKKISTVLFLMTACVGWAFADEGKSDSAESKLGFRSGGYVFWENYRLWEADYNGQVHKGDWFNSILGGFVLENNMSERLKTRVALEARFFRPFPEVNQDASSLVTKPDAYVHEAKAVYSFGDVKAPPVEVEVGYFLYDYNKDQHNLGEYLFRSKIYPINLFTDFELPMDRLLGIRVGNKPFKGFHQDLLLTSEYKYYPKSDFTLSYLADYNIGGVLTLGGGISFRHAIAVRPSLETPTKDENTFLEIPQGAQWTDSNGVQHTLSAPVRGFITELEGIDSLAYSNPNNGSRTLYEGLPRKTTNYSYQGQIVMGRATFDPKPLVGNPGIFGAEDMKLYSEIAILGLKDYDFLYPNMKQRIPVMFGFDVPCFRFLDVLGIEGEYFAYKLPDNWERSLIGGLPQPGSKSQIITPTSLVKSDYAKDDWKWSVYVRKEISRGLIISAQAASDHLRLPDKDGNTYQTLMKDTGTPFVSGQWWGIIRVTATY